MLRLFNKILTRAPKYSDSGLVGFPINAILAWPMATVGGYAAFLNDKVNKHFKDILNSFGCYLKSADSCSVLNSQKGGWFSKEALAALPGFPEEYDCDPAAPHYGYTSWDDFLPGDLKRDSVQLKRLITMTS